MATQTIYRFKPGARIKGNAEEIGTALEQVRTDVGGLTARNVVTAAKPKDSILHKYFDWNQQSAAQKYREHQARHLIASVTIAFRDDSGKTSRPVHAFVATGSSEDRYQSILIVMESVDDRRKLLAMALSELAAFQKKYESLAELAAVFQAAQKIAA